MTKQLSIGLVTSSFPNNAEDYRGNFVAEHAEALSREGHSVSVFCPDNNTAPHALTAAYQVHRLKYAPRKSWQTLFGGDGIINNLASNPLRILGLASFAAALFHRLRDEQRLDLILSHWLLPSAVLGAISRPDLPHVAIAHSGGVAMLEQLPHGDRLASMLDRRCNGFAFVSSNLKSRFERLSGHQCRNAIVTPMGIELRPRRCKQPHTPLRLLFIGRLVPIKNLATILNAIDEVSPLRLTIAGDGPSRRRLQELSNQRRLPVTFLGAVTPTQRDELLLWADALIVPSKATSRGRTEGAPRVIQEALAAGVPVLASDCGGIAELVGAGGQILENTGVAWRNALLELCENPARLTLLGHYARQQAENFSWSIVGDRFRELFDNALAERAQ